MARKSRSKAHIENPQDNLEALAGTHHHEIDTTPGAYSDEDQNPYAETYSESYTQTLTGKAQEVIEEVAAVPEESTPVIEAVEESPVTAEQEVETVATKAEVPEEIIKSTPENFDVPAEDVDAIIDAGNKAAKSIHKSEVNAWDKWLAVGKAWGSIRGKYKGIKGNAVAKELYPAIYEFNGPTLSTAKKCYEDRARINDLIVQGVIKAGHPTSVIPAVKKWEEAQKASDEATEESPKTPKAPKPKPADETLLGNTLRELFDSRPNDFFEIVKTLTLEVNASAGGEKALSLLRSFIPHAENNEGE